MLKSKNAKAEENKNIIDEKVFQLKNKIELQKNSLILFTGYNLNVIGIDTDYKTVDFLNLEFGEKLSEYKQYTYLKNDDTIRFDKEFLRDFVLSGSVFKDQFETEQTAFLIRILEHFCIEQKEELSSFLIGMVISENIKNIQKLLKSFDCIHLIGDLGLCKAYKMIIQKNFDIAAYITDINSEPDLIFDKEIISK